MKLVFELQVGPRHERTVDVCVAKEPVLGISVLESKISIVCFRQRIGGVFVGDRRQGERHYREATGSAEAIAAYKKWKSRNKVVAIQGWGTGDRSEFTYSPPVIADIDGDGTIDAGGQAGPLALAAIEQGVTTGRGGLGNIYGAIIGGFVFAMTQALSAAFIPKGSEYMDVVAFGVLIIFLVFKPSTRFLPEWLPLLPFGEYRNGGCVFASWIRWLDLERH